MSTIEVFIADEAVRRQSAGFVEPARRIFVDDGPSPVAGASVVIVFGKPFSVADIRLLVPVLERFSGGVEGEILRVAATDVPDELMKIMSTIVNLAPENPSVDHVATSAGMCRRSLAAQLKATGLPPAGELIGWVRILLAAHALAITGVSSTSAANSFGFGSTRTLRRQLRAHGAGRPSEFRRSPAAFHALMDSFTAALSRNCVSPPDTRQPRAISDQTQA